jgi:S1-C subfamily serine protease
MAPDGQRVAPPVAAPWCLRLRDSTDVLGTGFLLTPQLALTCRHVVTGASGDLHADLVGARAWGSRAEPVPEQPADGDGHIGPDVAMVRLDAAAPISEGAPIGPQEPPAFGTLLVAFGFPLEYRWQEESENPGIWARLVVDGPDKSGGRLWLQSQHSHGHAVLPGLSGGPVIDPESGLVVGMISGTSVDQRAALMIPVRVLADSHPSLREMLRLGAAADPAFRGGLDALTDGNYQVALADFRAVCARWPDDTDSWFYVALAALGGQRPRAHPTAYVEEIDRLLAHAASLADPAPHVLALWALIREDHHRSRGIRARPNDTELRARITKVSTWHAREICRHVPAPETATWRTLNQWR